MNPEEVDGTITGRVLELLCGYLRPDLLPDDVGPRLSKTIRGAAEALDEADFAQAARALAEAREASAVSAALETLSALVARALMTLAIRVSVDPLSEATARWISRNVTAHTAKADRVRAIWRVAAGLAQGNDQEIHDHAARSALAGTTLTPVPGEAPTTTPTPGTEDTPMEPIDPIELRNALLAQMAFHRTGLPKKLQEREGQEIFIDAVVQGVLVQQHFTDGDAARALLWCEAAAGLMLVEGQFNPTDQRFYAQLQKAVVELGGSAVEDGKIQIDSHAQSNGDPLQMFAPEKGKTQRISIYRKTRAELEKLTGEGSAIFLQAFAQVARKMTERWDDHHGDDVIMGVMIRAAYTNVIADLADGGGGGGGGIANVDIPPLNDPQGFNDEIEPDNVRAVSTIYVTYQLEFALKAAARILDLFVAGLLPISASDGSARELDTLYWDQDDLLGESSRYSVYSRVLGAAGGQIAFDVQPNTEFNTLLMRVVSAVSEYEREQSALTHFDNASRGRRFQSTSGEFVRKAVRDFAANVSLRGWAGTAFTAERMAKHVKRVMRMLNLAAVKNAFGVTTPWQVVERVSQREFGITVNTVLHRTLAVETQTIMRIIADHHTVWSSSDKPLFPEIGNNMSAFFDLIAQAAAANEPAARALLRPGGQQSDLSIETTRELMVACQHFRAVTGVGDTLLDEYSTPVETQPMPSLPDMSGFGGSGAVPGLDMSGIGQLRDMVSSGQTPSLEQLRAMLPGF
jgi:hypothetical protein